MDFTSIKTKTFKIFKTLFIVILVALLIFVWVMTTGSYSTGDRGGTIIKLSAKGYLFKTMEGEMNLGMVYVEGNESSINKSIWTFSVAKDDSLIATMKNALLNGRRVKLTYDEKYIKLPWYGDSKYIVTGAEVMKE